MFLAKGFGSSEFFLKQLRSFHLILQILNVSLTYLSTHEQIPL